MTGTGKGLKLLETSYHELLKEIEQDESAKAAQAYVIAVRFAWYACTDCYYHSLQKKYEEEDRALALVAVPNGKKQSKVCEVQRAKKEAAKRAMWVDKYRPTKFTDLLGEEVGIVEAERPGCELKVLPFDGRSARIVTSWDGLKNGTSVSSNGSIRSRIESAQGRRRSWVRAVT